MSEYYEFALGSFLNLPLAFGAFVVGKKVYYKKPKRPASHPRPLMLTEANARLVLKSDKNNFIFNHKTV